MSLHTDYIQVGPVPEVKDIKTVVSCTCSKCGAATQGSGYATEGSRCSSCGELVSMSRYYVVDYEPTTIIPRYFRLWNFKVGQMIEAESCRGCIYEAIMEQLCEFSHMNWASSEPLPCLSCDRFPRSEGRPDNYRILYEVPVTTA